MRPSATATNATQDWSLQLFKSVWPVGCKTPPCYMSKTSVCSYAGAASTREQCCSEKNLLRGTKEKLTDEGHATFKLGESTAPDNLLGSSAETGAQAYVYPTGKYDLNGTVPKIVGSDSFLAGLATPSGNKMSCDGLELYFVAKKDGGCVSNGSSARFGTVNMGAKMKIRCRSDPIYDNFRSGGVSAAQTANSLGVFVADITVLG